MSAPILFDDSYITLPAARFPQTQPRPDSSAPDNSLIYPRTGLCLRRTRQFLLAIDLKPQVVLGRCLSEGAAQPDSSLIVHKAERGELRYITSKGSGSIKCYRHNSRSNYYF